MRIIPIKDLRDTNKISDMCNSTNEPIFITKNGYGDMVIMSMETYEKKMALLDMREKLLEGLGDYESNNIVDGKSVLNNLKEKYVTFVGKIL